jgi:hypothetical protein
MQINNLNFFNTILCTMDILENNLSAIRTEIWQKIPFCLLRYFYSSFYSHKQLSCFDGNLLNY